MRHHGMLQMVVLYVCSMTALTNLLLSIASEIKPFKDVFTIFKRKPRQPNLVFMLVLYPRGIGIWRCQFLCSEENQRTQRKTL